MNAKFRGLRKDGKGWAYGTPIYACGRVFITADAFDAKPPIPCWTVPVGETWEVIPSSVGQFTGLLDKNGVKIFKGDTFVFNKRVRVIVWDNSLGRFDCEPSLADYCGWNWAELIIDHIDSLEIIGTIHGTGGKMNPEEHDKITVRLSNKVKDTRHRYFKAMAELDFHIKQEPESDTPTNCPRAAGWLGREKEGGD